MEAQIINTQNPAAIIDLQMNGKSVFSITEDELILRTDNNVGMACVNPSATLCVAGSNPTLKLGDDVPMLAAYWEPVDQPPTEPEQQQ